MPTILGANTLSTGYNVANSLRFNNDDDAELIKTPSSDGNRRKWTFSCWVKRSQISSTHEYLLSAAGETTVYFRGEILSTELYDGNNYYLRTNRVFRDPSAWYHIVCVWDTENSTQANRMRLYVNNVEETSFSASVYPTQNYDSYMNKDGNAIRIGSYVNDTDGKNFDGYMAEVVLVDGQALTPSSFGEFDEDSPTIWKPKSVSTLSLGTNGFYLDFEDSGNLGNDKSGGTDFTATNLAATDQSTDTCTNNFLTWNPLDTTDTSDLTFSEGNLKVVNATGVCRGTLAASSGKWYWEIKQITAVDASNPIQYGVADTEDSPPTHSSLNNALIAYSDNNSNKAIKKFAAGTESTITSTMGSFNNIAQNDIIQFAFDADTAKLWVGRNGTYLNSGDPANGTGEVASTNAGNFFTPCLEHAGVTYTIESNFGSPPYSISSGNTDANGHGNFEYAVPSGFYAWNTKNLAEFG
jgi:hypothetical protein